jgi:tetratricopeptide (TPR) repeat protein
MRVRGSIGSLVTALIVAGIASYVPGVEAAGSSPSSGGGGMDMGSIRQSPEETAKAAFRDGAKAVKQADKYAEEAATAPEAKKAKAAEKAQKQYEKAKQKFVLAIQQQPKMHEAWNYLGYTSRKLGFYNDALTAYAEALKLKPGFPEAIEYRGEAYLGLNQLEDAKTAYMALFRDSRPLADQLMAAMQKWVSERRANSAGVAADDIEKFAQWIAERTTIAQQTASLAVDAPRTNWN